MSKKKKLALRWMEFIIHLFLQKAGITTAAFCKLNERPFILGNAQQLLIRRCARLFLENVAACLRAYIKKKKTCLFFQVPWGSKHLDFVSIQAFEVKAKAILSMWEKACLYLLVNGSSLCCMGAWNMGKQVKWTWWGSASNQESRPSLCSLTDLSVKG